jgi:hypothetical protein
MGIIVTGNHLSATICNEAIMGISKGNECPGSALCMSAWRCVDHPSTIGLLRSARVHIAYPKGLGNGNTSPHCAVRPSSCGKHKKYITKSLMAPPPAINLCPLRGTSHWRESDADKGIVVQVVCFGQRPHICPPLLPSSRPFSSAPKRAPFLASKKLCTSVLNCM